MEKFRNFLKKSYSEYKPIYIAAIILLILIGISIDSYIYENERPDLVEYSEFLEDIEKGDVFCVFIDNDSEEIRYTLNNKDTRGMSWKEKSDYEETDRLEWKRTLSTDKKEFKEWLLEQDIPVYSRVWQMKTTSIIALIGVIGIPIAIFYFIYYQISLTKPNKNMITPQEETGIYFRDIIGHDDVIGELNRMLEIFLSDKTDEHDIRLPKGVMFVGEPGTGKTMLAKALAQEANLPFYYASGSSFIEMYAGLGARNIRQLFKVARKNAPCVVFIDEIDSIGKSRGSEGNISEDTQTLNALLTELDGFNEMQGVLLLAATNRIDDLDPALIRVGRFDKQIEITPPRGWRERLEILEFYTENKKLDKDVDLKELSKQMYGFTGADIYGIANDSAIQAFFDNEGIITMQHFEDALDKKLMRSSKGVKKNTKREAELKAVHEAGHALVMALTNTPIARASIVKTSSDVGGMVVPLDENEESFITKQELKDKIRISYGGRAAEELVFGSNNITAGASSDLDKITKYIRLYVERFGFSQLGNLNFNSYKENDEIISTCYEVEQNITKKLYSETLDMLINNKNKLDEIAKNLLEKEVLSGKEIESIVNEI